VVNPEEAARVRKIFELYLHLQALLPVVAELERRGWKNKFTTLRTGQPRGGKAFDKVSLQAFLRNPIYIGKLRYDGELYDGEHEALVSPELFQKVGAQLHQNAKTGGVHVRNKYGAILKGLLYCTACGKSMIHSYTIRVTKRYRYYRCGNAIRKGHRACPIGHISAPEIERLVVNQIQQMVTDAGLRREVLRQADLALDREIKELQTQERQIARVLGQNQSELRRLAGRGRVGEQTTARLAQLHDLIAEGDVRLEELRLKQAAVEKRRLVERDVVAAFSDFDTLWQNLTIREQVQITRLLVARVDFDVHESEVAVTYHPLGIAALAQKRNEDAA
jgi:site-specific DNA recombinase